MQEKKHKKFINELKISTDKILEMFDIKKEEYVEYYFKIKDFFSYSINIRNDTIKPNLIFIHGYGATSAIYFNFFKYLLNDFNIYSLDLPGMGLSSIPLDKKFKSIYSSSQQCLNYLIDFIKKWIDLLDLKEYYLMGHSFGGYLISHFANIYPEGVKNIYLISPGGFNKSKENERKILKDFMEKNNVNCFIKYIFKVILDNIFQKKGYPFKYFYKIFRIFLIKRYFKRFDLQEEHLNLIDKILNKILDYEGIGYNCVGYIFNYGMRSDLPICEIYDPLLKNFKVFFYYGEKDWMDKKDTIKFCEENNLKMNVKIIKDSFHQTTLKSPLGTYEAFSEDHLLNK